MVSKKYEDEDSSQIYEYEKTNGINNIRFFINGLFLWFQVQDSISALAFLFFAYQLFAGRYIVFFYLQAALQIKMAKYLL